MNVFWILLVALLNTNGNKGDPNYGVRNLRYFQEKRPVYYPYIVSVRDKTYCHVCTGSVLSQTFVLTSSEKVCRWTSKNVFYGFGEFVNCQKIQGEKYMIKIEEKFYRIEPEVYVTLLKLNGTFNPHVANLELPPYDFRNDAPYKRAVAIGWSCLERSGKCVMTEIAQVILSNPFNGHEETFLEIGDGTALIDHNFIFELLMGNIMFIDIFDRKAWIQNVTKSLT